MTVFGQSFPFLKTVKVLSEVFSLNGSAAWSLEGSRGRGELTSARHRKMTATVRINLLHEDNRWMIVSTESRGSAWR